jgi:hypothetical protein
MDMWLHCHWKVALYSCFCFVESSRDSVRTAWSISLAVYIAYGTIGTLVAVALTSLLCWYRCWCWVMQTLARLLLSRGERVCSDAYQLTGILISFPFYVRQICAQHVLGSVQDNRWCDFADRIRSKLGLEPKSFHITLGFAVSDVHDIDKSFQSIKQWEEEPTLYLQVCSVFENYRTTSGSSDSGVDVSKLSIILSRIVYYYLDILQADYPLTCGQQLAPRSLTTAAASKAPQAQQLQQAHKSNMEVLRNLCTFCGPYCHIQGLVIEISNWLLSRGLIVLALKAMAWCYMRCGPHFCSDVDCLLPVRVRQMDGKASATTATSREKLLLWNWNSLQYSSKGCESVIQSDDSEYSQPSSSSSSSSSLLSKKHTTVYSISHQSSAQSIFDKYSLPRNFSFIRCFLSTSQLSAQNNGSNESGTGAADGISWYHKIAGSAIPVHEEHMTALHGVGIGLIITLHEVPLPSGKILVCAAMCTCQFRCLLFYSVEMQLFESPLRHMESLRCTCMWSIELRLRSSNSGKSAE